MRWHIVTGEYPPQPGGVSDYTHSLAHGLVQAGDAVAVWAPPCEAAWPASSQGAPVDDEGVDVYRLPDRFGPAALRDLDTHFDREQKPCRILVQYVPHAFGRKAMNLPFCWWLRSRRHDSVWVMFHEVAFPFDRRQAIARNLMAAVTRRMAAIVGGAAERAFVSIPAWERELRFLVPATLPIEWLPVPSAIPVVDDLQAVDAIRHRLAGAAQPIVGHFGTYGSLTRPLLEETLPMLLDNTNCRIALLGRESAAVADAFAAAHASARGRVFGTGLLDARELSLHLSACDVMLQPYPDGISSRRTSAMAGLAHARATATTEGWLTETIWRESSAVALSPAGDAAALAASIASLIEDPARARRLGELGRSLYDARFDLRHTIAALRQARDGSLETTVPSHAGA